jgi:PEP-CTERM motif
MKCFAQWLGSAVAVVALMLSLSSKPVFADSYTIINLGNDNGHGIYGLDNQGQVVVWGGNGCGLFAFTCYTTYQNGVEIGSSSKAPDLVYDNGSSCGSTPAGYSATKKVCNNGWIGLGSAYNSNGDPNGIYFGVGEDLDFMNSGYVGQLFLNSAGDFVWTDGLNDQMYEAVYNGTPGSTPEPASLLLVGTGLLLFLGAIRNKATRPRSTFID